MMEAYQASRKADRAYAAGSMGEAFRQPSRLCRSIARFSVPVIPKMRRS